MACTHRVIFYTFLVYPVYPSGRLVACQKNQKKNRQLYKGIHGFLRVYICLVVVGVGWVGRVILWRPGTKKKCEIEKYMQIAFSNT